MQLHVYMECLHPESMMHATARIHGVPSTLRARATSPFMAGQQLLAPPGSCIHSCTERPSVLHRLAPVLFLCSHAFHVLRTRGCLPWCARQISVHAMLCWAFAGAFAM